MLIKLLIFFQPNIYWFEKSRLFTYVPWITAKL